MNHFSQAIAAALLSSLPLADAMAQAGTVSIEGMVTRQSCKVTTPDQAITLPLVAAAELQQHSPRIPFSIEASGCFNPPRPGGGPGVAIPVVVVTYFEAGGQVNPQSGRLRNQAPDGPANVELQLRYGNGQIVTIGERHRPSIYPIPVGESDIGVIATSDFDPANTEPSSIRLNYSVEYAASGGRITPGPVSSYVTYTLEYY